MTKKQAKTVTKTFREHILRPLDNLKNHNNSDPTIKNDLGQHSQFLRCFGLKKTPTPHFEIVQNWSFLVGVGGFPHVFIT